jgi:hypothetical protein
MSIYSRQILRKNTSITGMWKIIRNHLKIWALHRRARLSAKKTQNYLKSVIHLRCCFAVDAARGKFREFVVGGFFLG